MAAVNPQSSTTPRPSAAYLAAQKEKKQKRVGFGKNVRGGGGREKKGKARD